MPKELTKPSKEDQPPNEATKFLYEKGIYFLDKEITNDSVSDIYQDILMKELSKWAGSYTIYVNSTGGDAATAWALIDLIDRITGKVTTIGTGEICSAATMILAAGVKGERSLTKNSTIMIHEAYGSTGDLTATQHEAYMKSVEEEHRRHVDFWLKVSNLRTVAQVKSHFLNRMDNYFTPKEAIELGIVDKIL